MEKGNLMVFVKSGLIALFLLILANPSFAQVNTEQLSTTVIDTVDDEDDLFDENTNYKELYKDLNKDGDWVQIKESELDDDSGDPENVNTEVTNIRIINVWRPRNMGSDWSPYSEGRWVYTYSGWVWATDYDWGWAAYHYGRWVFNEMWGWVWMPGRYWAPSWVQWCYNPIYIGWYPIYPRRHGWHHRHHGWHDRFYHGGRHHHWVIVKRNRFTEKINKNVVVDRNKNAEILNGSKTKAIIKNNGGSLENVGPKVETIEKNTGQKIQPKEINYSGSKGKIKVDDTNVNIYRNDVTKTEKVNNQNGTKTKESNTGTKTKDSNTGTKTKESNTGSKNNENYNGTKTKESNTGTKTKDSNTGTKTKDSNTGTKTKEPNNSTKTKDTNSGSKSKDNNTYKNKESNTYKGSSPPKESTKNRESTKTRESTTQKDSNRGNSNRESNSSKGNKESNSSKGNNNTKPTNRK